MLLILDSTGRRIAYVRDEEAAARFCEGSDHRAVGEGEPGWVAPGGVLKG